MEEAKKIIIGGDHAGYSLKKRIVDKLSEQGWQVEDVGTHSDASMDYPDVIHPLAEKVGRDYEQGIILCGSGNGAAMTANKHAHIRAALCWNRELAALARRHNDANVLAIPARFVSEDVAFEMVETFLHTPFEEGRHARRVDKIAMR